MANRDKSEGTSADVTRILDALHEGSDQAAEKLLQAVYNELRRLATQRLAAEAPGQTLQPTALVHEAYLKLVQEDRKDWKSRAYFFGAAAQAMRRILVDRARKKARLRHGGDREREELSDSGLVAEPDSLDLLALDEALGKLASRDARKAELVQLRYFTGLTLEQCAEVLGISRATAERDWTFARAFLYQEVQKGEPS